MSAKAFDLQALQPLELNMQAGCYLGPGQRFQGLGQELRGDPAVGRANCVKGWSTRA